ncbi:MAG: hypothetical protein HGA49_11575, partial [Eubacteriaceae bacterium]|nr:hypothetical protein [Eubacteriaceae bacterium]
VIVQEVSTEQSLMTLISRGIGISLVFNCLKYFFTDSIAYVPLKDPVIYIDYGFVWRKDKTIPNLDSFHEIAKEIADSYSSLDQAQPGSE